MSSPEVYEVSTFDPRRGVGTIKISADTKVSFDANQFQARGDPKPGRQVWVEFDGQGKVKKVIPVPRA